MAKSQLVKLVAMVFMCMLVNSPHAEALNCSDVNKDLSSCLTYILIGGNVGSGCCNGIKILQNSAQTKPDQQTACNCLKSLASRASDSQIKRAAAIPGNCGVTISFTISHSMKCSWAK